MAAPPVVSPRTSSLTAASTSTSTSSSPPTTSAPAPAASACHPLKTPPIATDVPPSIATVPPTPAVAQPPTPSAPVTAAAPTQPPQQSTPASAQPTTPPAKDPAPKSSSPSPKPNAAKSRHRASSSTSIVASAAAGIVAAIARGVSGSPPSDSGSAFAPSPVPTPSAVPSTPPGSSTMNGNAPNAPNAPNASTAHNACCSPNASGNGSGHTGQATHDTATGPYAIPPALAAGVPMLKVSSKKIKPVNVRLSPTTITWPSLKGGKVEITSIRELRLGQSPTDTYAYDSARWITIVYVRDKQWKVVHFIARTDDVYNLWVKALHELVSESSDKVVSGAEGHSGSDPELRFIRQLWPAGVTAIDKTAAAGLCAQLGLNVPPPIAAKYEFPLDLASFRQLVRDVQTRPELGEIYQNIGANANLSRERVHDFLKNVQGEGTTGMDLDAVFSRYADPSTRDWNAESLATYLASVDNKPNCKQDLTRPLPEYYIASSHNTYLVAEQWRGSSTVEGYIRVLLSGCRSVEIDCHDGGSDGPIVYHGMTITSSVPVRDVCQAINKYAFVASPYPVIISLEIRCDAEQQDKLATIIKESFGERLVTEPIDAEHLAKVPSPENLKGRILIKTKPMPQPTSPVGSYSLSPPVASPPLLTAPPMASPPSAKDHSTNVDSTTDSTTESDSSFVRLARRLSINSGPKPSTKTPQGHSRALTDLPVYTSAVKYKGFSKLVTYDFNHMFSVSERTAHRILKDGQGADWAKHNLTHLTRVYPKGVRLTSSNFDPRPFWLAGAQLVAINYQTKDMGSLYNDALFHASGYVLKPISLRQKMTEMQQRYRLRIKIISAQRLPPTGDLYVEVTVGEETYRTKSTKAASLSPRWNEELVFDIESKPSLLGMTFVHAEIRASKGIVAQWTRPLSDTGRGYRYLPLVDRDRMKYLFATLFVRIDVEPVASKPPAAAKKLTPSSAMAFVTGVL